MSAIAPGPVWQYIVSGYARSGTSMMMRCMELGGIECHYDKHHKVKSGSNKYGSYEVPRSESVTPEAYKSKWESMFNHPNKCVKIELMKIKHIPRDKFYRVVMMLRHPQRIYLSLRHQWGDMPDAQRVKEPDNYYRIVGQRIVMLSEMPNVELSIVEYSRVIKETWPTFLRLKNEGWPIDPEKAAAGVESTEMRF